MRLGSTTPRRVLAGTLLGALALAACGGDGGSGSDVPAAEAATFLGRDLGGEAVGAASEIDSNLFPDLVVDNVSTGAKVNLRNVVPSDKPILLWLWAPH